MTITSHGDLSIMELIVYIPIFFLSLWVSFRHGFGRQAGWIFLTILSVMRIVGSALQLASESTPKVGLIAAAAALEGIGLSPLLLATLGILKRVNEGTYRGRGVAPRIFTFLATPIMIALILAVVGGVDLYSSSTSDQSQGRTLVRVAIIMFIVAWAVEVGLMLLTFANRRNIIPSEAPLLTAVALSMPFLAVRLVYSAIGYFSGENSIFNPVTGSATLLGCMAILMEIIVIVIYLVAGFTVPPIARHQVQSVEIGAASKSHGSRRSHRQRSHWRRHHGSRHRRQEEEQWPREPQQPPAPQQMQDSYQPPRPHQTKAPRQTQGSYRL